MMMTFKKIQLQGRVTFKGSDGKTKRRAKTFWQTISPFNRNEHGEIKTEIEIYAELRKERDEWIENTKKAGV